MCSKNNGAVSRKIRYEKKRTLLYVPLVLLFAFGASVLTTHYARIFKNLNGVSSRVGLPFSMLKFDLTSVEPEAPKKRCSKN